MKDLHLAQTKGKITLALRGFDEDSTDVGGLVRDGVVYKTLTRKDEPAAAHQQPVEQVKLVEKAVPVEPPPVTRPPHGVVIHRGSTHVSFKAATERLTFRNAESTQVLDATKGPSVVKGLGIGQLGTGSHLASPWQGSDASGDPDAASDSSDNEASPDRSSVTDSE